MELAMTRCESLLPEARAMTTTTMTTTMMLLLLMMQRLLKWLETDRS
jgi:hypothetical protein